LAKPNIPINTEPAQILRNILLIVFFLYASVGFTQLNSNSANSECDVSPPVNYLKWRNSVIQNNVSSLKHDLCVNKKYSIVFYAIADSNGNPGVSQTSLNNCIALLNNVFSRICVSFMNCSLVVIPNHPFNRWTSDTIEPTVRKQWWTLNTINLYLPDSIVGPAAGYASMPGGPGAEIIVIEKGSVASSVAIHEMGHFFGLPHTWDEIGPPATPPPVGGVSTNEFVRRTNCYTNGDGFCDTEADCYPVNKDLSSPCQQKHGAVDGYGDYYIPPVDNYMTYFKCGCRFTQEQYNMMANTALTQLLYLH
jgi:hypothetical protein